MGNLEMAHFCFFAPINGGWGMKLDIRGSCCVTLEFNQLQTLTHLLMS